MKFFGLILALLLSTALFAAPMPPKVNADRNWYVFTEVADTVIIAIDPQSFQAETAGDIFRFEMIIVSQGPAIELYQNKPIAAVVFAFRISCASQRVWIIADADYDANGNVLSTNRRSAADKSFPIIPDSPVGVIVDKVCRQASPLTPAMPPAGNTPKRDHNSNKRSA